jgi:hypothetical protein
MAVVAAAILLIQPKHSKFGGNNQLGVRIMLWTFQGAHEADIVPSFWHMPFVL